MSAVCATHRDQSKIGRVECSRSIQPGHAPKEVRKPRVKPSRWMIVGRELRKEKFGIFLTLAKRASRNAGSPRVIAASVILQNHFVRSISEKRTEKNLSGL